MARLAKVGLPAIAAWWALLVGVWLVTLSSITESELIVAVVSALPCAVAARAASRATGWRWQVRPAWARWLLCLPAAVVADTARVLVLPLRRRRQPGQLQRIDLAQTDGEDRAATQRALAAVVVSAPPGSYVVNTDPERDQLLVHTLVHGRPDMGQAIGR